MPPAPTRYWAGVALAGVFVLTGLAATVGISVRSESENLDVLRFAPGLAFWVIFSVVIVGELSGMLGLVLRRSWATFCFALSLLFTILFYAYLLPRTSGQASLLGPIVITLLHAVLVWFAASARRSGWLAEG